MEFASPYWNTKTKIELLQRWILVHSHLYYDLNTSIIEDHMFDNNSKQLVTLQEANIEAFKQSRYFYAMYDFDGSSGFGMVQRLTPVHFSAVTRDASMLINRGN